MGYLVGHRRGQRPDLLMCSIVQRKDLRRKKKKKKEKAANVDFNSCCIFCVDFLWLCFAQVIHGAALFFTAYSTIDPGVQ